MSPAYLSYPGSYIFLYTKHGKPFKWDAQVGLARRVNPPSITLEEKARFPSSGGLHWYVTSPIYENPITLSGGSRPPPLIFRPNWKNFFRDRSFPPPPPPPYLKVWICDWLWMANLSLYFSLVWSSICIVWMQRETEKCKFLSFLVGCHQFSFFKFCFEAQAQFSVDRWIPGTALLHCLNHLLASIFLIVVL